VDGQTLRGKAVIICAGSVPRAIPGMDVDGVRVTTSTSRPTTPRTSCPSASP
jgi:pyruvate/2-oxoglutarate dehydrogenase complex dihydrolipoamide dehydrogenase (E3) component